MFTRYQGLQPLNREGWLTQLARMIEPLFKGHTLSQYRLSCGWPSRDALSLCNRRVGECHPRNSSRLGIHEIFISPVLEDSLRVAGVVCHELAHIVAGVSAGHGPRFQAVCRAIGLTRGPASAVMPGDRLEATLAEYVDTLGPYPHGAIFPSCPTAAAVAYPLDEQEGPWEASDPLT